MGETAAIPQDLAAELAGTQHAVLPADEVWSLGSGRHTISS